MSKFKNPISIFNIVASLLMLILFAMQCFPFWETAGEAISIQEYTWFPKETENQIFTSYLSGQVADFSIDGIVLMPIFVLIFAFGGTALSVLYTDTIFPSIVSVICGITGILGYLLKPVFQLNSIWILHLVLSIIILLVALVPIIITVKNKIKK